MLATVLDAAAIESAAAAMRELRLAPGESLVTEGRTASDVYVVRAGRLRVTQGGGEPLALVETGDIVDETGSIPALARQASLIAETECRIYAIAADVVSRPRRRSETRPTRCPDRGRSQRDGGLRRRVTGPAEEEAAAVLRWQQPEYQPAARAHPLAEAAARRCGSRARWTAAPRAWRRSAATTASA